MSDQAADTGQDVGTEQEGNPNDALMERMNELSQKFDSFQQPAPVDDQSYSEQAWQSPYEQQDPEPDTQGYEDPDTQALNQFIAQAAQQQMAPLQQQIQQMQEQQRMGEIQRQAQDLETRYPDLKNPEVAGPLVRQARQQAEMIGFSNGMDPAAVDRLARSPQFIETLFRASRAENTAQGEMPPQGQQGAVLEGSSAQVDTAPEDLADTIVNAGRKSQNSVGW